MVCHRCTLAVEEVLRNSAIRYDQVITGEIHLPEDITSEQYDLLRKNLSKIGLELIDNRMSGMIEKIKQLVLKKARNEVNEKEMKTKLSSFLSPTCIMNTRISAVSFRQLKDGPSRIILLSSVLKK